MIDKQVANLQVRYEEKDASSLESLAGIPLEPDNNDYAEVADMVVDQGELDWGCGDSSDEEEEEVVGYKGDALRQFKEYVRLCVMKLLILISMRRPLCV